MRTAARSIDGAIRDLDLERYALELEVDGLTVVPPEVHGFGLDRIERCRDLLLAKASEMTGGCRFTLDRGPLDDLQFAGADGPIDPDTQPSQFLIQKLGGIDRVFRDLALNPVSLALIRHLIGRETRLSSLNAFVKWRGEFGYGQNLGLHPDQAAVPRPWGRTAYNANTNWCLTEYTKQAGALAYVPGSHRADGMPTRSAAQRAVPVECPVGSVIIFHGATWHGAFPRLDPGMRIMIANYFRHGSVLPQENLKANTTSEMIADCSDPETYRLLCGQTDRFPYTTDQSEPVPSVVPSR